ncbi:MAG TPA: sensor histidine kinase, partial [Lachnospiraceae bacterium]|nr:sensor histidine kinase [Lachnospiraceae bacterium]
MSGAAGIFLLSLTIVLLAGVILYQQYAFRTGMHKTLNEMSEKLAEILDKDSEENVMVFTDHTAVMALAAQINRMLESRRRLWVDFRRSEAASR